MKKICLILISFILISCSFDRTFSNRESDKEEAEKITKKFYWELEHGSNLDNLHNLFSEKFFEVTKKEKLDELNITVQNEMGIVEDYNLQRWETLVVKGTNEKSTYLLVYKVKRQNGETVETFSLLKENEVIKIVGYNVNRSF